MHILFLTDNFPPEVNAPASRTYEHCLEWVKKGHKVTIITCAPNFPEGKLFEGYKHKLYQTEKMDGIDVIRVWSYITANEGIMKRTLDYLSFMFMAIPASFSVRKVDIVIGTSPQFFTVCGAYAVSKLKRKPFVFELRDLWPESIKAVGVVSDSVLIRLFERLELFLYKKANTIVSVTNSFRRTLISRGVEEEKIQVVTNGVDLSRFCPKEKDIALVKKYNLEGKFVAGYIGTHGMAHALNTLLQAAEILKTNDDGDRFRIILLGSGAEKSKLKKIAEEKKLDNVIFIDTVPKSEVARYWSLLDVSIIHLRKTKLFETVIPSKLFECMGMGIPVLHGVYGESAEIVEKENVGVVFEPENPKDLCSKLIDIESNSEIYNIYRENAVSSAKIYDRKELADKMLKILEGYIEQ